MRDRVSVRSGDVVKSTIVSARPPFDFLGTICNGEAQGLSEGRMIPNSNMCSNSLRAI